MEQWNYYLIDEEDEQAQLPLSSLADVLKYVAQQNPNPERKDFNIVAIIDKVRLLLDNPLKRNGQPIKVLNPDLVRANIVCIRRLWVANDSWKYARMADVVVVNPFLRDKDCPIKGSKKVTRNELQWIFELTNHLTNSLTSSTAVYTRQVFEIVDLVGQVLAVRVKQNETELFLRMPFSLAWPPYFGFNPTPVITEYISGSAPQHAATVTPELVEQLKAEKRLLVVHLWNENRDFVKNAVLPPQQTVILFGVHARRDTYKEARFGSFKLYSMHGGKPGLRQVVLNGSIFGNKMSTAIKACFPDFCRSFPPPPTAQLAQKLSSSSLEESNNDEFEAFFDDDFEEMLLGADFMPAPSKRLKMEEEETNIEEYNAQKPIYSFTQVKQKQVTTGSNITKPPKIPTSPGESVIRFFIDEAKMMVIGAGADIDKLAQEFKRKTQQAMTSPKQHHYRLSDCRVVDYTFGDDPLEGPRRKLANLFSLRKHCVLLFCARATCHFWTIFESVSEALKRQAPAGVGETPDERASRMKLLSCPQCHHGILKPYFWLKLVLEDPKGQRMSVVLGSPASHCLFNVNTDELLYGDSGSTKLTKTVELVLEKFICLKRGEEAKDNPRFTFTLRPAPLTEQSEKENLSVMSELLNEHLFGAENRTVFKVAGIDNPPLTADKSK